MTRKPPVIEPLAPDIELLLATDRAVAPLGSDVEERIRQRIMSTLKLPFAPPVASDSVGDVSPLETSDMPAAPLAETGSIASKLYTLKTIAVFVTGIATGAVGHAVYENVSDSQDSANENDLVQIQQATSDNPDDNPMSDSDIPVDTSPTISSDPISTVSAKTSAETIGGKMRYRKSQPRVVITEKLEERQIEQERTRILSAEQNLIEMAQSALARGRPLDALRALKKHQTTYPQGELKEEREALTVLSLVKLGKRQEAEILFARFRKRYPRSMFIRTITKALK